MSVITISRFRGSGGKEIAQQLAEKLGYYFVDKNKIEEIFLDYGLTKFGEVYERTHSFWNRMDSGYQEIMSFLQKVSRAIGKYGDAVILGRGGFAAFQDYSDVLNVKLWAPFDVRVQRIMKRDELANREKAVDIIESNDRVRRAFLKTLLDNKDKRESFFDILLNTEKVSEEEVIDLILKAAKLAKDRQVPGMNYTKNLDVDPLISSTVGKVLSK